MGEQTAQNRHPRSRNKKTTISSASDQPRNRDVGQTNIRGLSQGFLDYVRPYYRGDESGSQKSVYVLWVDIMGSQGKMLRNVRTASIPLMKLHVAALAAKKKTFGGIELFPVIDGIYVVSEHFSSIVFFLSDVFRSMAAEFLVLKNWERSIIRGAVAYGPVILGKECKEGSLLLKESTYADAILLGMPLVQAYTAERDAPPFGIVVHESVRAFGQMGERPIGTPLWRWWTKSKENSKIAAALLSSLRDYFAWCLSNPVTSGYQADRIEVHRRLADEYLGEFKDGWKVRASTGPLKSEAKRDKGVSVLTGPERQIKKLQERLRLTEKQIEQIKPILEKREASLSDLRRDRSIDREVRRLKILDVVAHSKDQIQSLLDETQLKILIDSEQAHSEIQDEGSDVG